MFPKMCIYLSLSRHMNGNALINVIYQKPPTSTTPHPPPHLADPGDSDIVSYILFTPCLESSLSEPPCPAIYF